MIFVVVGSELLCVYIYKVYTILFSWTHDADTNRRQKMQSQIHNAEKKNSAYRRKQQHTHTYQTNKSRRTNSD